MPFRQHVTYAYFCANNSSHFKEKCVQWCSDKSIFCDKVQGVCTLLSTLGFYTNALAVECLHSNFQTNYTSESKMVMKLYKYELSPPARLAHFVAEICQVDIEYVEVNLSKAEQFSTEFLTINPKVSRFSTSTMWL